MSGEDIGWLQTKMSDSTLFLGQLYLSGHMHCSPKDLYDREHGKDHLSAETDRQATPDRAPPP